MSSGACFILMLISTYISKIRGKTLCVGERVYTSVCNGVCVRNGVKVKCLRKHARQRPMKLVVT